MHRFCTNFSSLMIGIMKQCDTKFLIIYDHISLMPRYEVKLFSSRLYLFALEYTNFEWLILCSSHLAHILSIT